MQTDSDRIRQRYIELVKRSVGDFIYDFDGMYTRDHQTPYTYVDFQTGTKHVLRGYEELKENGLIASNVAHSLIGMKRLNQLHRAVETVLKENIPGDLIETGVLRGGACILMRAILAAYDSPRTVWVADSFEGFPGVDMKPETRDKVWYASRDKVEAIFARYDLLDEQVQFLEGWFKDTLPTAPIQQLAILRLDGDLYESTLEALQALYPKLAPGGYVIVDDYYAFDVCRQAVREYRKAHGITETIHRVDPVCVYWRKAHE